MSRIKMGKENLAFGDIETEKKIYSYKSPALLRDVHIEKVFASHKIFFGEKNYKQILGHYL